MGFYVVETAWRLEAAVRKALRGRDFEALYPTRMIVRRERRQLIKSERPLFGPYVFVNFDPATSNAWKSIPHLHRGVKRVLSDRAGNPVPLRGPEVARLMERCTVGPLDDEEVINLIKPDEQGLILAGIMQGLTGRCEWINRHSAALLVKMLGGSRIVEVPHEWVKPVAAS